MINLIIGKESNLSNYLSNYLESYELISSREVIKKPEILNKFANKNVNIIINSFQTAIQLNNLSNPISYIENSILNTSYILNSTKYLKVNKLIYTSSSSVYGDNIYCKENDILLPTSLHSALKIANEKLIEKFCKENNIDYTITRIFNMYGGNDVFSVISKIINAYKKDLILTIVNNGNAMRDFIHIQNVVEVYAKLLEVKDIPYINIGTGKGVSLREVLNYLEFKGYKIATENITKNEIKISTASIENLLKIVDTNKFIDVEKFIVEELN